MATEVKTAQAYGYVTFHSISEKETLLKTFEEKNEFGLTFKPTYHQDFVQVVP